MKRKTTTALGALLIALTAMASPLPRPLPPASAPPEDPPSQDTPAPTPPAKEVLNSNGKFSVYIGGDGNAYLHNLANPDVEPRFLGSDGTDARFDYDYVPTNDIHHPYAPVLKRVQLTFSNGTTAMINVYGFTFGAMKSSAALQALESGIPW